MSNKRSLGQALLSGAGSVPGQGKSQPLQDLMRAFLEQDALRRSGTVTDPRTAAIEDRKREGALMAGLMGRAAPLGVLPVALAGAGYEGAKGLAQKTGLGSYLPGPFKVESSTSPASADNVKALLEGFVQQSGLVPEESPAPNTPVGQQAISHALRKMFGVG